MNTYYSHKNVRNSGYSLTRAALNKIKPLMNEEDDNIIYNFQEYIELKLKQYNLLKQYKNKPNPEVIHSLLTQTEVDKQCANIPKNAIINSNKYSSLCKMYQNGHNEWKIGRKQSLALNLDNAALKSNGIDCSILNDYKKQLLNNKKQSLSNSSNKDLITINHGNGFNSQYDSFKCIHVNKQLIKKIYLKQSEEQINQFISQGLFKEELKLKSSLMPQIRTTMIGGKDRITDGLANISSENKKKIVNKETLKRNSVVLDSTFSQYNLLFVSIKSHFKMTPSSRSQMKMVLYINDSTDEPFMYLYGGVSQHRLDELWKCHINLSKEHEKDLVFNWSQVSTTGNSLACSGHSVCLYQDQLIIYGGIVNNQKTVNILEDLLFYHIQSRLFSSEKCYKESQQSIWRRNHIAEVIGKHLVIYGGIHEENGILNDAWAIDLVKLKWSKVNTNTQLPFLYSMASCLVLYSHHKNTEPISLYKLPQLSESLPPSPLKHEGIYVFGGIDSTGKCVNNLFIFKIGKPMSFIHLNSSGLPPSPRSDCTINFFEKLSCLVVHGGKNNSIKGGCYFNDFYFYDIIHFQWTRMKTNCSVPYRAEHCSIIYDDFLIIFGGIDGDLYQKSEILMVNLNILDNSNVELNPFELYKTNFQYKNKQMNTLNMLPHLNTNERESINKKNNETRNTANKQLRTCETQENLPQKYFDHFHHLSNQIKQKSIVIKDECQDLRFKNKRLNAPD